MHTDDVLSVNIHEAARRIGLSARTITKLIASKKLSSIKVGRRRLVTVKALHVFLRSRRAR
jgi:excisionase family DNA binding protein